MKRFIIISLVAMCALLGSCSSEEPCHRKYERIEEQNIIAYEFTYKGQTYIAFEKGVYKFAVVEKH